MSFVFKHMRTLLAAGAALLAVSSASAGDDNPPFEARVLPLQDTVQVEDVDDPTSVYDLEDGYLLYTDGIIKEGDVIWVERLLDNPRTVVALEDTHF